MGDIKTIEQIREAGKRRREKVKEDRRNVRFPKPGEMVATSLALCSLCDYGCAIGGNAYEVCDYYLKTGNPRECKQGECNKFKKIVQGKKIQRMVF